MLKEHGPNTNGIYSSNSRDITINERGNNYRNPTFLLGTVVHEALHSIQDELVRFGYQYLYPELSTQIQIFELNKRSNMYATEEDYKAYPAYPANTGLQFYMRNPVEWMLTKLGIL